MTRAVTRLIKLTLPATTVNTLLRSMSLRKMQAIYFQSQQSQFWWNGVNISAIVMFQHICVRVRVCVCVFCVCVYVLWSINTCNISINMIRQNYVSAAYYGTKYSSCCRSTFNLNINNLVVCLCVCVCVRARACMCIRVVIVCVSEQWCHMYSE